VLVLLTALCGPWAVPAHAGPGTEAPEDFPRFIVPGQEEEMARLREVLDWFHETQIAGGYRAYYAKDPARGSMQGGNVPGGLGLDREFFESILVPQVMLYGFLGFQATPEGFRIHPRLPKDWPELTITRIHLHDAVMDVTARADGAIRVRSARGTELPELIELPEGTWQTDAPGAKIDGRRITVRLPAGTMEISRAK
jgi:hypothetical protein